VLLDFAFAQSRLWIWRLTVVVRSGRHRDPTPQFAEEGIWLGRPIASPMPACRRCCFTPKRSATQCGGNYVPRIEQDPALWGDRLIEEAEALLTRVGAWSGR